LYLRTQEERETRKVRKVSSTDRASTTNKTEDKLTKEVDEFGMGSHDSGDPTTTNLYVGNISPQVTEEILYKEFAKYGTIGSVKIMWPRSDDEKKRGKNCGFVSFMDRESAEKAKDAMQGIVLCAHACVRYICSCLGRLPRKEIGLVVCIKPYFGFIKPVWNTLPVLNQKRKRKKRGFINTD